MVVRTNPDSSIRNNKMQYHLGRMIVRIVGFRGNMSLIGGASGGLDGTGCRLPPNDSLSKLVLRRNAALLQDSVLPQRVSLPIICCFFGEVRCVTVGNLIAGL